VIALQRPTAGTAGDAVPVAITGRMITAAAYAQDRAAFESLRARALEPNVFAEPAFVEAAAAAFAMHERLRVATASAVLSDGTSRLVGALPLVAEARSLRAPFARASARLHEFTVLSTPLLDRAYPAVAMAALLDAAANDADLPRRMALPFLGAGGAAEAAVLAAAAETGRRVHAFERYGRARMDRTEGGGEAFLASRFEGPKRRKYRSERRKFEATGGLGSVRHMGSNVPPAFEAFLALEAAGWKGRAGTAIANDPADLAFMRVAVAGLAASGGAEVHAIERDGRPVASGLILRSADGAWFHKIAYDEALAKHSPGVHLSIDVSTALQDDPAFCFADSCALRGGGLLEGSWTGTQQIADVLIDLVPGGAPSFPMAVAAEAAMRQARATAKALYRRLRDLR